MFNKRSFFSVLAVFLFFLSTPTIAADYGLQKIAQWGDPFTLPHTRTRCIGYARGDWPWPIKGEWKTCNAWATDIQTMQVAIFAKAIGPDNLADAASSIVQEVAKVCAATSAAVGLGTIAGTPSPDVATRLAAGYGAASAAFTTCIGAKASALTAVGVGASALKLAFDQQTFWSKWSNE